MEPSGNPLPRLKWQHWLATGAVAASLAGDLRAQAPVQDGPAAGEKVKREGVTRKVSEEERAIAENLGRQEARLDMGNDRFYMPLDQNRPWRRIFERLLKERLKLVLLTDDGMWEDPRWSFESSQAYQAEMKAGLAKRFPNGEMEKVEEDARAIYRKFQTAHPDFGEPPLATGPLPSLGDVTRGDAAAAGKILEQMEQHASFPKSAEGAKPVKLEISSGSRGHSITIRHMPDLMDQVAVIDIAREIVNAGDHGLIHLVFDNETDRGRSREGVSHLTLTEVPNPSCIVTKEDPSTPYPPGYRSDGLEIAGKPPVGDVTGEATAEGKRFLEELQKDFRPRLMKGAASGTLGHTLEFCEVSSPRMQVAILERAQEIVNKGDFKPVYIEFTDRGYSGADNGFVYRSRVLVKRPPGEAGGAEIAGQQSERIRNASRRGLDFLNAFATRADYPDCQIMDYENSTTLEIYGETDTARQDKLLKIVQDVLSRGVRDAKPVHVEFRDRRQGERSYGASVLRPREKVLRSRLITWHAPISTADAAISDEVVACPPMTAPKTVKSRELGKMFRDQFRKKPGVPDFGMSTGHEGISITFTTVAETERQLEILDAAQEIIDQGELGKLWVHIEFLDNSRQRTMTLYSGQQIQRGTMLRGRTLTYKKPE